MLTFIRKTSDRWTPSGSNRKMALYRCSCGKEKEICIYNVKCGHTVSCGCANVKQITALGKTSSKWKKQHGMFGTRFYNICFSAKNRCTNKNDANYKFYGAKGIEFLWDNFLDFKRDMFKSYNQHCKEYGIKQTTLDRLNSKDNYYKENCRWATYKEQAREKIGMTRLVDNLHKNRPKV